MIIRRDFIKRMIDMNPGGCVAYLYTADGMKLLGVSEALAAGAGYSLEELSESLTRDPFWMIYQEDSQALQNALAECFNMGRELNLVFRLWGKDNRLMWVISRGKIIGMMENQPVLFATIQSTSTVGSGTDIINRVPTGLGIFKYKDDLHQVFLNDSFYEMLGADRMQSGQFCGKVVMNGIHPDDKARLMDNVKRAVNGNGYFQMSMRLRCTRNASFHWIQLEARVIGKEEDAYVLYASFTNIDYLKEMSIHMEEQQQILEELLQKSTYDMEHDELTGLYNRKKAYAESEKLLAEHPHETFAIVYFDIQRFRLYNSFFGEEEGDRLICFLADMFRDLARTHAYGVYGRIEADIFFLCFPMSDKVLTWNEGYIHRKLLEYRTDFVLSGSSGVYIADHRRLSVEAMVNRAMEAGKQCKENLMKHVCIYSDEMENQMMNEQQISREMRHAIENQEFAVYLQPKYDTCTGEPYGAEALVRWIHPERGLIPPNHFIPLFEKNGFINTLDKYMWEKVCQLLRRWTDEGREVKPISVNVSRVSVYSPETVSFLKSLIKKYQIDPKLLNLELTESAYMNDPEAMKAEMRELQEFGFQIMMDDFGSGYSSLNTLREMYFDYLKVDRMFLASVTDDPRSRAVLQAVIYMAKSIDIPVIAEGVEKEQERALLKEAGCDYIQGFLFARPMPVSEYEQKIL